MVLRRRDFIGGALATLPFAGELFADTAKPLFRVGIMTDTHVGRTLESCSRVKQALALFRTQGVDMVINNGDIADHFYPEAYPNLRRLYDEAFAGTAHPREIWTYAWHDSFEFRKGVPRADTEKYSAEAFEEVRRLLKAPNGHTEQFAFHGYPFVVFPQHVGFPGFITFREYEEIVAKACAENPGKPVFVVDHPPPRGTTFGSWHVGDGAARRRILNRYPQVVALTGHTHGSLRSDLFIWQGEFTVVNSGCLQVWRGGLGREYGVVTMDVHPSKLVFRRWDVRDGSEIGGDDPWIVPLPYDPKSAPWNWSARAKKEHPPRFAAGTSVSAAWSEDGKASGVRVSFPAVPGGRLPMRYRIDAERRRGGKWIGFAWSEIFSEFYLRPSERTGRAEFLFPESRLDRGSDVRFAVRPVGQYGTFGAALVSAPVSVPAASGRKVLFESADPEKDLAYVREKDRKPIAVGPDGLHVGAGHAGSRLVLPTGLFAGPVKSVFRVTVDMRTVQPEDAWLWRIRLVDARTGADATGRQSTSRGDSGAQRWAFDVTKKDGMGDSLDLAFDWGDAGHVRFNAVRVERLS